MPALKLMGSGPKTTLVSLNLTGGLTTSIFSGHKEATAIILNNKSHTRAIIIDRLKEINAKQRAKQDVLITAATAIDTCLARYTTSHYLTAAELIRTALTAALENLISPPSNPSGGLKNPEKLGSQKKGTQLPKTRSASTSYSKKNKLENATRPTKAADLGTTPPNNSRVTWAQVASKTHKDNHRKDNNTIKNSNSSSEGPAPAAKTLNKVKANTDSQKPDDRIFIQVPLDYDWRKITAIGAKQELISFLKLKNKDITYFQEV